MLENLTQENNNYESFEHKSVMLNEMLEILEPKDNFHYLDCTFGAGGYSKAILSLCNSKLTAIDCDIWVEPFAKNIQKEFGSRFEFVNSNFAHFVTNNVNNKKYDGIVLDLGVSTMQLKAKDRGFSFLLDGPLDMRMNNQSTESEKALDFINNSSETEIADVIYYYGNEVQSRTIAKAIVKARKIKTITKTLELADIVRNSMHYVPSKIDLATKTFQAIRIYINHELESIRTFLNNLPNILKHNGIVILVSFHELEDRIVKQHFKKHQINTKKQINDNINYDEQYLEIITKKPITPTQEEIKQNNNARSAKLRAARMFAPQMKENISE